MNELAVPQYNMSDLERMAAAIANSGLFGIKTPEQALALMLLSQAEGLHPATAARDYHIIQGRPALKADAILARFQRAGGKVEWTSYTDTKVSARFSHPAGGTVEVDWTLERARAAGLGNKDNWKSYPRQMLRARVISEGVRTVFPAVLAGFYTPEEVIDMESAPAQVNSGPPFQPDLPNGSDNGKNRPPKEVISMIRAMREQGLQDRDLMLAICSNITGREITSRKDLTPEEATKIRKIVLAVTAAGTVRGISDYEDFWVAYLEGTLRGDLSDAHALVDEYTKLSTSGGEYAP